jgi:hypothetical protein
LDGKADNLTFKLLFIGEFLVEPEYRMWVIRMFNDQNFVLNGQVFLGSSVEKSNGEVIFGGGFIILKEEISVADSFEDHQN